MKWLDIWVSFSERHFVVSRNHDDNKYRQIGVNRYLLGFLPKVGFQEVCVGLFWRPNPTPKRVVGFHICHFFLLGPSTPCQSIKTALLAVQNCFAQGVHHLIGVVLGPNRPFASPSKPSILWWRWEPSQYLPSMAETISGTLVTMHVRFCIGVLVSFETKPNMHWSKVMSRTSSCSSKYCTSEGHGEDSQWLPFFPQLNAKLTY